MAIKQDYNINIIPVGSIPNYQIIFDVIKLFSENNDVLYTHLIEKNNYDIRTEKSIERFFRAIKSSFLNFNDKNHEKILLNTLNKDFNLGTKKLILFWQLSLSNKLFRDITNEIFLKSYFSEKTNLYKEDIISLIKSIIENNPSLKTKWSEATINGLASKYLTILKKLELAEGVSKKTIKKIYISDEALVIFICLVLSANKEKANFLENSFLPFSFISKDEFIIRVKKLSLKGIIEMSFNGSELKIEPKIEGYLENVF